MAILPNLLHKAYAYMDNIIDKDLNSELHTQIHKKNFKIQAQ